MIRRLALSSLIGAAAAASMIAGATPALAATPATGTSVSLAAFATPLPSDRGDRGHDGHNGHNGHNGHSDHHGNWGGNHFRFDNHRWDRHDWNRHHYSWNWWRGTVSAQKCRDHNGHVDRRADLCIGGRYSGYRID
jgi:hypothetical protein